MTDETRVPEAQTLWSSFVDALTGGPDPDPTGPAGENAPPAEDPEPGPEPDLTAAAEHQGWGDYFMQIAADAIEEAGFRQEMADYCAYHGDQEGALAWDISAGQSEQIAGDYTGAAITEYGAAADAISGTSGLDTSITDASASSIDTTSYDSGAYDSGSE